jgi:5-(carboxyamino)imidazole ribonucleotide mutase
MKKNKSLTKTKSVPAKIAQVGIIMGSQSDYEVMKEAGIALKELGVDYEMRIVSAHRTPKEMMEYATTALERGLRVIIAGAGGAAHLPGMVASLTAIPVIGVPVPIGELRGEDSLLSIVQMPKGVPVATVAIGNAFNAGILAAQILAFGGSGPRPELGKKLEAYKAYLRDYVLSQQLPE